MAFSSATVSIGASTKKSDYDRLLDNTKALKDEAITLNGVKTFQSGTVFEVKPKVDGIQTRSATGSVSIECEYIDASATHSVINFKTKIIEIGAWDMDATTTLEVDHGISNVDGIIFIEAWILPDSTATHIAAPLGAYSTGIVGEVSGTCMLHSTTRSTKVRLIRTTGGTFDGTGYNDTGVNRGFITIRYMD